MLAAAIDACEWLLVEQDFQAVLVCHFVHHVHQKLVVVYGFVDFFKYWGYLKLTWSHLVVTGRNWDSQLVGFNLKVHHKVFDAGRDATEVMVLKLLTSRWGMPKNGASCHHQVGTGSIQSLVYHKILLLDTQGRRYFTYFPVKQLADCYRSLIDRLHGLQKRRLVIECLACVGHEDGGNAKRLFKNKNWR